MPENHTPMWEYPTDPPKCANCGEHITWVPASEEHLGRWEHSEEPGDHIPDLNIVNPDEELDTHEN